jgi:uncharacterized membrane protein
MQSFKRGAIRPLECLSAGWRVVKDDYWLFLGMSLLAMFLCSIGGGLLAGPAMCGLHYCLFRRERGVPVTFDMMFRGFDYFVPGLIATLLTVPPILLLVIASYIGMIAVPLVLIAVFPEQPQGGPPEPALIWSIVGAECLVVLIVTVLGMVVQAMYIFIYPLIVDRKLSGWEAVMLSARAALGNLGGVIVLMVLTQALAMLGVLLCYVGVIFVLPITFAMISIAYRQVFGVVERREFEPPEPEEPIEVRPIDTGIQSAPDGAA